MAPRLPRVEPNDYGPCPPSKELRVREIMRLMSTGRWVTGETWLELVEAWGVSEATIKADASEASRRVKAVADSEFVNARLCVALDEALDDARHNPREVASVAAAYSPIAGAARPTRSEVTMSVSRGVSEWDKARGGDEAAQLEVATVLAAEVASFSEPARRVLLDALARPMLCAADGEDT